jgi:retron-type reverse transcriptase
MNFLLHFFCHSRLLERAANMGHGYSLTALPIIECVWTRSFRMKKMSGGVIDGSSFIQATVRSNPKAQLNSTTVKKEDINGVQESNVILFRRAVPKFDRGTSECAWSHLEPRKQVNKCFHRHGVEFNCTRALREARSTSFGHRSRIFTGGLGPIIRPTGRRIYSTNSHVQAEEDYSGTEDSHPTLLKRWGNGPTGIENVASAIAEAKKDKNGKYINIFPIVYDEQNLKSAWSKIKSKPGNSGGTSVTLDNLKEEWFATTSKELSVGGYRYASARRINIPKGHGKEGTRPLTIANPRDKIVQQAFLQVLSPLWEGSSSWSEVDKETWTKHKQEYSKHYPKSLGRMRRMGRFYVRRWDIKPVWLNSSFGFRPARSVHSALEEVKLYWKNIKWFIKFDIRKAFDRTDHHILTNMLREVISDERLIAEIYKMLDVNIVNFKKDERGLGVPQGSVLSPFLFNVFMHRLDVYMSELVSQSTIYGKKKENPLYTSERHKLRAQLDKENSSLRTKFRAYRALRKKLKRAGNELHLRVEYPRSVHYVRYADDFLIGVCGDKEFAKDLRKKVLDFVKSNMNFEVSLSKLVHAMSDKTEFLGFILSKGVLGPRVKGRTMERFHRLQRRIKDRRTAEYSKYLRMLKESEKRFWIQTTDSNLRKAHQTMMSQSQILLGLGDYSKKKVLESLRSSIDKELADQASMISLESPELLPLASAKLRAKALRGYEQKLTGSRLGAENPRLSEAKAIQDRVWEQCIRSWVSKAKATVRIVPSDEAELLQVLGESELKELLDSRHKYFSLLDKLDSSSTRKKVVDYVYSKHKDKIQGARSGGNASSLIQREFARTTCPPSIYIQMPYELIKADLTQKGYIKGNFPTSKPILCIQHDLDIISHYNYLARGLLNFYCCADNRWQLVKIINWHLRYSLIHTLAHKYNRTVSQTIKIYSKCPTVWSLVGGKKVALTAYIGVEELYTRKKEFLTRKTMSHENILNLLEKTIIKT